MDPCQPGCDLRRTFASWQVEAGVPLFPIAQAMGWIWQADDCP